MFGPANWPNLGRYTLVNGLRIPTITMAPGEVRRLRLVHSGQREAILLKIEASASSSRPGNLLPVFHEIALDGLPTGAIAEKGVIELQPGYRSDVLLQAPVHASGEYYLADASFDVPPTNHDLKGADGSPEPIRWIAKLVVTGQPVKMDLPVRGSVDRPAAQGYSGGRGVDDAIRILRDRHIAGRELFDLSGRPVRDAHAGRAE